jgi:hypothetical protein
MNNNSSCPIYQINNINPPEKRHPSKLKTERERDYQWIKKKKEKKNWKGAGRRRWGHCCQRGFQHRRNQPLKAEPPLSSALISNQTLSPAHTHPFSLPLFASLASFDFSTLLLAFYLKWVFREFAGFIRTESTFGNLRKKKKNKNTIRFPSSWKFLCSLFVCLVFFFPNVF